MIDLELSFFLWQEIRMLRLNLAQQPEHLREAVMAYEEKLTFSLIEKGTMEDLLELIRSNSTVMRFLRGNRMTVEVKKWKYSRPPHIPEGETEFVHPCGCREYEEDGIWSLKQCRKHRIETEALIRRVSQEIATE